VWLSDISANTTLKCMDPLGDRIDVAALAFPCQSTANTVAMGGKDGKLALVTWASASVHSPVIVPTKSNDDIRAIAFHSGQDLIVAQGNAIWILDKHGNEVQRLSDHRRDTKCLALSRDGGHLATGSVDDTVLIYSYNQSQPTRATKLHTLSVSAAVLAIAFSPDGTKVAYGDYRDHVYIHNVADGKRQSTYDSYEPVALAWSADGNVLAAGSSKQYTTVFDTASGEQLFKISTGGVTSDPEVPAVLLVDILGKLSLVAPDPRE
jgi:WD40 repeat protein